MNPPRFLIDENLSVRLAEMAWGCGFEAMHVAHSGMWTWQDWSLLEIVGRDGWTLVTNNAIEFRGRYARLAVHPGVVFLVPSVPRSGQIELFRAALADIAADPDLVNKAIDVAFEAGGVTVRRYDLP